MLRNNLKLAWRNLLKSKYTSGINLTGLVVGMTAAILLWQYVAFEKSYDDFHEKGDRIVRVRTDRVKDGEVFMQFAAGAGAAGPFMHKHFSEVEDFVKLKIGASGVYANGERNFREENAMYASNTFFQIFSQPMLSGDPEKCLAEPFTGCVSESTAKKYFGAKNPIGETLKRNGNDEFKITGVYADWPENSHLKPDILLSYITYSDVYSPGGETETAFFWDGFYAYLLLQPDTDVKALEAKIPAMIAQKIEPEVAESVAFALQPLNELHLTSHYLFEAEVNGDATAVRSLLIIGILVLLIAWFNYVNLATARSETRAREVGVRKVIGSSRADLIRQFLMEAGLLNILAICISLGLAQILMPWFEELSGKAIPFNLFSEPKLWGGIIGVFLLGTLLVGLYPAFVLSSFRPAVALSGKTGQGSGGGGGGWLRKGLVVVQFAASVILIVGTIVISQQLSHMQNAELGVQIDQTLVVKAPSVADSTYAAKWTAFKHEINGLAAIEGVAGSTDVPGQQVDWTAAIRPWGGDDESYEGLQAIAGDYDFAPMYGLTPVAGRLLSKEMVSDSSACVLNERGVERLSLGSPEEAIGVELDFWGDKLTVVGVVKNFHQQSPKLEFESLIFRVADADWIDFVSIRTRTAELSGTLSDIENKWASLFPENPFDYFFLDEHFAKQFEADQRLGHLIALFAGLAIFVSCLGLFALAAFVAERRTKEIGIRKVLGASIESLVGLLSKEFILLVGIAIVIATPLAWYLMDSWLQSFQLRIEMQWWMFALAGTAAVSIAFLTMSFQSVKAALANPVKSLKSE